MKKVHSLETTKFEELTKFLDSKHKDCKGTEYKQLLNQHETLKTEMKFQDEKIDQLSELVETQQKKIEKYGFIPDSESFDQMAFVSMLKPFF